MSRRPSSNTTNPTRRHPTWNQSFADRAALPNTSPLAAYLLRLMATKRTNLCLSADVQSTSELLEIAEECGDSICVLKTHCDIIYDFSERTTKGLLEISARKKFLIFEDRKFGDIGSTVQTQYAAGTHRIASWAAITNAHIFPGPAIITALKSAAQSAVSVSGYSNSTAIYGGEGYFPPGARAKGRAAAAESSEEDTDDEEDQPAAARPKTKVSESSDDGDNDGNDDDDDNDEEDDVDAETSDTEPSTTSTARIPIPRSGSSGNSPMDLDGRKSSIVSISTTISSSTEYVSPDPSLPSSSISARTTPVLERPPLSRGLLLLAQMSSEDNLFTPPYTNRCVELARQHPDFVMGFIAQQSLNSAPGDNFLVMTPGVNLPAADQGVKSASSRLQQSAGVKRPTTTAKGDSLGQQYNTPRSLILDKGVDVVIVGRGILNADDREAEAERYRWEAWKALSERTERRGSR